MIDKNKYNELVNSFKNKTSNPEMLGFLQRFYSLNMINELVKEDSLVRDEWTTFMKKELADMYSTLDPKYTSKDIPVITIALMESSFPEFLDSEYSAENSSSEQRQAAALLVSNSRHYESTSSLLKGEIVSVLMKNRSSRKSVEVPVVGDLSKGYVYSFKRPIEQYR